MPKTTPAGGQGTVGDGRGRRPSGEVPMPAAPGGSGERPAYQFEEIGSMDLGDGVGAPAANSPQRTPSGRVRKKSGPLARRTPAAGSAGAGRRQRREAREEDGARGAGAEIGVFHQRGMGMRAKFSIFVSLLILFISLLFGLVVVNLIKRQMTDNIVQSGYLLTLALRRTALGAFDASDRGRHVNYRDKEKDVEAIKNLIESSSEQVFDVAVLVSTQPVDMPKGNLLTFSGLAKYDRPSQENQIFTQGLTESGVMVWRGEYITRDNRTIKGLFFCTPVNWDERAGPGAGKNYCAVYLVLSMEAIDRDIGKMTMAIAVFGLIFVGAGIFLALWMAGAITGPLQMLVRDLDLVSRGDLDHQTKARSRDEIGLLAMAFNRMTKNLKAAREREREAERINSELSLAREIHGRLLPEKLPHLPGVYDIWAYYESAKEVGGDYYDFIPVDNEHLAIIVADVSGKGVPGSMVMGTTRTIMRLMSARNLSAASVLTKTNHHVARDIKRGMFVTAMYAVLNVRKREMIVASAGHNPMVIWRAATRTCELVRPNGIALGFDKGPVFERTVREQRVQLARGDRVLMYTDGVVEAMNENHEEWGDEALYEFTAKNAELSSKDFVKELFLALRGHQGDAEQHDDITISTFRVL
jgi:serine phosphatase RsbU (regulator of sigma subunit)